jgi:hypothetical protein
MADDSEAFQEPRFAPGIVFTPEGHFIITALTPADERLMRALQPLREEPS